MSARRDPSTPPEIPGLEHSRLLGMGGFADVFLYTQLMPRRPVAVKVLLDGGLGADVRERFRTEADLMARLSHHPSIVTILHADVARDGRPYLVMEYCSRAGLGQRYRTERMSVPEVLRIGVRLACAVETAHRAGILHRDIKPANVLVTDFGWPALTDFGIAATTAVGGGSAMGMSIPWSPPELLAAEPGGDVRSDVYSLAATLYSLLAGRSPFEGTHGSVSAADLVLRIERAPLAPIGRADVPPTLQALLERAMDRVPDRRHPSALALARALGAVESELRLPVTALDLPEDGVAPGRAPEVGSDDARPAGRSAADGSTGGELAQATHVRPVRSVEPGGAAADTPGEPQAPARPARRARVLAGAASGALVLTAVAAAGVLASRPDAVPPAPVTGPIADPGQVRQEPVGLRAVPSPAHLRSVPAPDGAVVFSWTNPDPQDGDRYLWGVLEAGREPTLTAVTTPSVTVQPPAAGVPVCIEVSIVRADRRYSTEPAVGCAPA